MVKYLVVFEKTDTGFSAYVPDLPGIAASGKDKKMVEQNIYEAITFHLETLIEDNIPLPEALSESEVMVLNV